MLIWIGKHRREDCGATETQVCERCHNPVEYRLIRSYRMVSFNFIPLFAVGTKWRHECPVCAHGRELASNEVETHKRAALLAAAHAHARDEESATTPLAPVRPSHAEAVGNDADEHTSGLRIIAVVVAAIVVFVLSVAIFAPKNAPTSSASQSVSSQAVPVNAPPKSSAQAAVPRTPVRASNARPMQRTPPRAAASPAASSGAVMPHADATR